MAQIYNEAPSALSFFHSGEGVKKERQDGVYPTIMGHELIKKAWIEEFKRI